jgi:hypothetical protein
MVFKIINHELVLMEKSSTHNFLYGLNGLFLKVMAFYTSNRVVEPEVRVVGPELP